MYSVRAGWNAANDSRIESDHVLIELDKWLSRFIPLLNEHSDFDYESLQEVTAEALQLSAALAVILGKVRKCSHCNVLQPISCFLLGDRCTVCLDDNKTEVTGSFL